MKRISLIFFLLLLYQLIVNCDAAVNLVDPYCSEQSHDYTVQEKVKYLFSNLSSQASKKNFYNYSVGDDHGEIYGLFQCRGDLNFQVCTECIQNANLTLAERCAGSNEAIVWYYECMLLYSNRSVFPLGDTIPFAWAGSRYNVSNPNQFNGLLNRTIEQLIFLTAVKSSRDFAVQEAHKMLYTFAQCIPVISAWDCVKCLQIASAKLGECCSISEYAMVYLPSCQLRYAKHRFYNIGKRRRFNLRKFAVFLTVGVGIVVISGIVCFKARRRKVNGNREVDIDDIKTVDSLKFKFNDIKTATNNFSAENKLGRGGFGEVYKGKLRTGEEVAIKRLSRNSDQGLLEFKNEVLLVAKLQHRNLVRLLGFCIAAKEKIVVYELLRNSSLDRFLNDPEKRASLNWETRFKIIIGIARGLQYLHEDSRLKIIHRDLKSSNILLDEEMNPKISDFGIAKLVALDEAEGDTSRIVGTYGYMAPEYAMAGQFSEKSDVYSFGVMVLEIISGQRNSVFQLHHHKHKEELLQRAWRLWNEGRTADLVDSLLGDDFSIDKVKIAHHIGLLCVHEDAGKRPRMLPIVTALNGNSITLPLPTQPLFFSVAAVDDATRTKYYSLEVEGGIQPIEWDQCLNVANTGIGEYTRPLNLVVQHH